MAQLLDAFEDREQAADAEQHQRHDERPEVTPVAEPEWVLVVRRSSRGFAAVQQQALIAGVGHRVDRFGEHRRGPGDEEHDELGDRDRKVREQRGDDSLARPLVTGHYCNPPRVILSTSSA